jgi:hypothetical protein
MHPYSPPPYPRPNGSSYGYAPGLGNYGFPPLAALLPIAAKAVGAIAPVAAKAAGALAPIAGKAFSALAPMAGKAAGALLPMAKTALPSLLTSLPGMLPPPGGLPGLPGFPGAAFAPAPPPSAGVPPGYLPMTMPAAPMAPAAYAPRRRRRRRRSYVRVLRDRSTGEVKAVRPIVALPAPAPLAPAPVTPAAAPTATETSGGMAGWYGHAPLGYAGARGCGRCGGLHGPGLCGY